jgi:hypothetical protein
VHRRLATLLLTFAAPLLLGAAAVNCSGAPEAPEAAPRQRLAPPAAESATAPSAERQATGAAARIPLAVRETAGIARESEVLQSGIPLPRSPGVTDPSTLAVVGPGGRPVPADFRVLARWNAGRDDAKAPIQWLLVAFPATVEAGKSALYTLVTDGSAGPNPAPPRPMRLRRQGDAVVVDTGAAVFRLGGEPGALFDEAASGGGRLVTGGGMTLEAAGKAGGHSKLRGVRVEHSGPLSAVVIVEGAYGLPEVGGGGFGSKRRYVFTAGSPVARVRHAVAWEGNLECPGCLQTKAGRPNGVLVTRARDALALDLGGAAQRTIAVGDFETEAVEGPARGEDGKASPALVRQKLRPDRKAPLAFEVAAGGRRAEGKEADGGMLAVSGPSGTVAVALAQMHRYEPQALRLLPDGRLAVDLVDDKAWLANHQGLFANLAVALLPPGAGRRDLDRLVWAPLNRPLRAWPDAEHWYASGVAEVQVPAGRLPRRYRDYDTLVKDTLGATLDHIGSEGIAGIMTFGLYPRYWGKHGYAELSCKGDPTPGEDWDHTFWCGAWTDYHNTVSTAALWAMRSGEVEWLDRIAFPGAWRMLHTQITQCGPEERWFYCGQSPMGYGAYRVDFNSSHAYFDNLFLYYWLTGDSTVVDTVRRGGENMRRFLCKTRGPTPVTEPRGPGGPACGPHEGGANLAGRVASQWLSAFRFLGLAGEDPSFLEDFRSGLARAYSRQYAELVRDGRRYGFLGEPGVGEGSFDSGPWWTNGFYDAENLYRYQVDTEDAPLGDPELAPSGILAALARTLAELDSEGAAPGSHWGRLLTATWTGPRVGGKLTGVKPKDRPLYFPEKAGTTALLARAARETGDPKLREAADRLIAAVLGVETLPLGKIQGQNLTRLHGAVAAAAAAPEDESEEGKGKPEPAGPDREP